jgi:hypothetical protein
MTDIISSQQQALPGTDIHQPEKPDNEIAQKALGESFRHSIPSSLPRTHESALGQNMGLAPVNNDITLQENLVHAKDTGVGAMREAVNGAEWLVRNAALMPTRNNVTAVSWINQQVGEPLNQNMVDEIAEHLDGLNAQAREGIHETLDQVTQNILHTDPEGQEHQEGQRLMVAAEIVTAGYGLLKAAPKLARHIPKMLDELLHSTQSNANKIDLQALIDKGINTSLEQPEWSDLKALDDAAKAKGDNYAVYAMADDLGSQYKDALSQLKECDGLYVNVEMNIQSIILPQNAGREEEMIKIAQEGYERMVSAVNAYENAKATIPQRDIPIDDSILFNKIKNGIVDLKKDHPDYF